MQVNILEAKNRLSELIQHTQAGEEVVIANRGVPVARLVKAGGGSRTSGIAPKAGNILDWLTRHPLPAHARRTRQQIEAALREERDGWD